MYEGCSESNVPHFFLGNYLFRMYEIQAQYNWVFPLHILFFHTISSFVYGLMPARNKGIHAFPVPAKGKQDSVERKMTSYSSAQMERKKISDQLLSKHVFLKM